MRASHNYLYIYLIICIFICGGSAPARSVSRDGKMSVDEEAGGNGDRFLVSAALLGLFFSLTRAKPAHRSFTVYFPPAGVRLFLRESVKTETRKPGTATRKLELFNLAINLSPLPFSSLRFHCLGSSSSSECPIKPSFLTEENVKELNARSADRTERESELSLKIRSLVLQGNS